MRARLWLVLALAPALLAMSCPPFIGIDVRPGATASEPELHFRGHRTPVNTVDSLAIHPCPAEEAWGSALDSLLARTPPVWSIAREAASASPAARQVTYGRVPAGYREISPAQALRPGGCYTIRAIGTDTVAPGGWSITGGQTMRLLPDGRMIVGMSAVPLLEGRTFRQLNRAAVGCRRGYHHARTPARRAAVDAREYVVMDARLSCGWLATHWPDVMDEPVPTERTFFGLVGLLALMAAALSGE